MAFNVTENWPPTHPDRVFKVAYQDRYVWVKRAQKDCHNKLQRFFCWFSHHATVLDQEAKQIQALRARGVHSPDVLEIGPDYLVLSDIGPSLQDLIRHAPADTRETLITRGVEALSDLHARQGWHGNAALRNLTEDPHVQRIGFIDFDATLRKYLPLTLKQSYDLWQFCHSAARFDESGTLSSHAFKHYTLARNKWVVRIMCAVLAPFAWLLSPMAHRLGRDVNQTVITVSSLFSF